MRGEALIRGPAPRLRGAGPCPYGPSICAVSAILVNRPAGNADSTDAPRAAVGSSPAGVAPQGGLPGAQQLALAHARVRALERAGRPDERVEALSHLARLWVAEGGLATAEAYLESALPWADLLGADAWLELQAQRAELVLAQADALQRSAESDPADRASAQAARHALQRALGHVRQAAGRASASSCPDWEATLLLRLSDVLDRCGAPDEAAALQLRALRLMGAHVRPDRCGDND